MKREVRSFPQQLVDLLLAAEEQVFLVSLEGPGQETD
jgi:hypothetical protein